MGQTGDGTQTGETGQTGDGADGADGRDGRDGRRETGVTKSLTGRHTTHTHPALPYQTHGLLYYAPDIAGDLALQIYKTGHHLVL